MSKIRLKCLLSSPILSPQGRLVGLVGTGEGVSTVPSIAGVDLNIARFLVSDQIIRLRTV